MEPGYLFIDRSSDCCPGGDLFGRILRRLGFVSGSHPNHWRHRCRYWAEFPSPFWISRTSVGYERFRRPSWLEPELDEFDAALIDGFRLDGVAGTIRLASEAEYDFATAFSLIQIRGHEIGWVATEGGRGRDLLPLRPPGSDGWKPYFLSESECRLLWIPPETK